MSYLDIYMHHGDRNYNDMLLKFQIYSNQRKKTFSILLKTQTSGFANDFEMVCGIQYEGKKVKQ